MQFDITLSPQNRIGKVKDYNYEGELICSQNTKKITLEQLQKAVTPPYSRTWSNIVFSGDRRTSNFKSMQVIALDFDNKESKEIITPLQIIERCKENGFDVSLIYSTFSHTEEIPRFRTVWILDKAITNATDAQAFINILYQLFPEADNAKDLARLWLGGKDVLYMSDYTLSIPKLFETGLFSIWSKNHPNSKSRDFKSYVRKHGKPLYYIREDSQQSACEIPLYEIENKKEKFDWAFARGKCCILDTLITAKEKVWHNDLFFLASNMFRIKGGEKLFADSIEKNPNICNSKKNMMSYIKYRWKTAPIYPISFKTLSYKHIDYILKDDYTNLLSVCPYTQYSKAELVSPQTKPYTLDKAKEKLDTEFRKAMADKSNKIYIFRCATGLGKTSLAIKEEGVAILFPSHSLKDEMSQKAIIPHICSPEVPWDALPKKEKDLFDSFYDTGLIRNASSLLRKMAKSQHKYGLDSDQIKRIRQYVKDTDACNNTELTIFSTHQKGVHVDFEGKDTYIFDEDPLYSFAKRNVCTTADLRKLANVLVKSGNTLDAKIISDLVRGIDNGLGMFTGNIFMAPIFNDIDSVENAVKSLAKKKGGNIFAFLFSEKSAYVTMSCEDDPTGDKEISYINHTPLKNDKKYIILSATADEWIYRKLYGDRVVFIDISNVEMKGKLVQYSNRGFGRRFIRENADVVKLVKKFKNDTKVLTFKGYQKYFDNAIENHYFGHCEGSNEYSGKDLKVVGTPHVHPITYRLLSRLLGVPTTARDFEFANQKMKRNGYEFTFCTSANKDVQRIQTFCIEKELIQAVGRARLLHNDCIVYVFSNYPLPYAEQRSVKEIKKTIQLQPNIKKKKAA